MRESGFDHVFHYIDDFVLVGPPGSEDCERGLRCLQQVCSNTGVILASDKTEGPTTRLTVLGIEFDTQAMMMRLPDEKLQRLQALLDTWHGRGSGSRGDLESLVGILQHASKVVRHGRCFLRRLYDLLAQTQKFKKHFRVRLNGECQADIEWWVTFSRHWNGASILRPIRASRPDVHLWSDASGSWGCGAIWQGQWLQVAWDHLPIASASIAPKEFFPILAAGAIWGRQWRGSMVCAHCDNGAVVEIVNSGKAKDPLLAHQLRALFYLCAFFEFDISAVHTPGHENGAADAISRNNTEAFLSQVPYASREPSRVPVEVQLGLSTARPCWRSPDWTSWFADSLTRL